jgi:hypothetical protein
MATNMGNIGAIFRNATMHPHINKWNTEYTTIEADGNISPGIWRQNLT